MIRHIKVSYIRELMIWHNKVSYTRELTMIRHNKVLYTVCSSACAYVFDCVCM